MVKKRSIDFTFLSILFCSIFLAACSNYDLNDEATPAIPTTTVELFEPTEQMSTKVVLQENKSDENLIWIEPGLEEFFESLDFDFAGEITYVEKLDADYWITSNVDNIENPTILFEDYFILSVPFINRIKNVDFNQLRELWDGSKENSETILWIKPGDKQVLTNLFGKNPGENVIFSNEQPENCNDANCWRISNFLEADPNWRIVPINNQSLISKDFESKNYPLVQRIYLQGNNGGEFDSEKLNFVKTSNYDPSLLSSLLMTGTTALVRNIAVQIEENGYSFPLENISDILHSVDLVHVSNEVPFYSQCPPAIPVRKEMRFCSNPEYIEIFKLMGVDIVELSGNHLLDWGPEAFLETLSVYKENQFPYYAGGENPVEAKTPLIIDHNGNQFAFLGCNFTGPENNWVTEERPGTLACDLDELQMEIERLKSKGINPIFTFQHNEFNTFRATQQMQEHFSMMAQAGAVIVSGSQAHYPQGVDFVGDSFIHYGLGNFLFDQMYTYWGMATIDIHYFYDNQYINTYQLAIINENNGQPRLMTEEEEELLFSKLYSNSFYFRDSKQ